MSDVVVTDSLGWYIAECKPTKERSLRRSFESAGYEVYVASQKRIHVYACRNRREVETVVIPGKIFVRTTEDKIWDLLLAFSAIHRFMIDRVASDPERGRRVYACVSDSEMQQMQNILNNAPNPVMFTTEELTLGQRIEVVRGPLKGLSGKLARIDKVSYIVLQMKMGEHNYVFTEISIQDVKPLDIQQ